MRYFVYSTLTNDHKYTNWNPPLDSNSISRTIRHEVLIKGGANRATLKQDTPRGIRTEITEKDYEELQQNRVFQRHEKEGLLIVKDDRQDPEDVAREMQPKDKAAPLTPDDPIFRGNGEESIKPMDKGRPKAKAGFGKDE